MFNLGKVEKIYYEITPDYDAPSGRMVISTEESRTEYLDSLAIELAEQYLEDNPTDDDDPEFTVDFYKYELSREPIATHRVVAQLEYSFDHIVD